MIVIDEALAKKVIQPRPAQSHKGDYGRLLLIGGLAPYGGAIIMAALAAVKSGAGLVTVATGQENISALHAHLPEAMAFDARQEDLLAEQIAKATTILIGPGLGESQLAQNLLQETLAGGQEHQTIIIDGSALTLLAEDKSGLIHCPSEVILTPHQKEWERLSQCPISEHTEQTIWEGLAAFPSRTTLVYKRHHSLLFSAAEGILGQISVGGPAQATGGSGDTLAGMIAAFVGQFPQASLFERVATALYLHSAIADELAKTHYVVLPTQVSSEVPKWMANLANP